MTLTAPLLGLVAEPAPAAVSLFVPADTTDEQLVELWLHGKSAHTQRAYRTEAERFLSARGHRSAVRQLGGRS